MRHACECARPYLLVCHAVLAVGHNYIGHNYIVLTCLCAMPCSLCARVRACAPAYAPACLRAHIHTGAFVYSVRMVCVGASPLGLATAVSRLLSHAPTSSAPAHPAQRRLRRSQCVCACVRACVPSCVPACCACLSCTHARLPACLCA